jgi:hypothetical protein
MAPEIDLTDLKLIVRALHRDVSALDDRLRRVEAAIGEVRPSLFAPDLVVLPGARNGSAPNRT